MVGTYPFVYVGSMLAAVVATPLVVRLARRFDMLDRPDPRKVHRVPIPRIGGIAIVIAMIAGTLPGYLLDPSIRADFLRDQTQLLTLIITALAIFWVGLLDDIFNLPSKVKLVVLILAGVAVRMSGMRVDSIPFGQALGLNLEWLSWPLTIGWICIVTVAINFIDGLDGLAAGISAIAIGVIAVIAANNQDSVMIVPAVALLGSLTGFLFFNFNPAKIFMGDCGSMFIGFTLAVTAMKCNVKTQSLLGLALPAMALGIPLFDTAITMIRRGVLQRRSIFSAEKGHIHHKLIDSGMDQRRAVLTLYGATIVLAGLGVAMLYTDNTGRALLMVVAFVLTVVFFRKVGGLKLWETIVAMRRNVTISRDQKGYRNVFEQSQLRLATAYTFDDWWRETCEAARALQFRRLALPLTGRDGIDRVMEWTSGPMPGPQQTITVSVPIRQRRAGGPLKAEAEVAVLDSLESAGARVTFFGRLMEDYCIANLPAADAVKAAQKKLASLPAAPLAVSHVPTIKPPRAAKTQASSKTFRENRATPGTGGKRRIAIVHDFLYVYAGAEKVLEQMIEAFPDADIFALFDFLPHKDRGFLKGKTVHTSFIQRMPMAPTKHRHYLPLMPLAIEQLDVSRYDIVISSSYCAAKGVITSPNQIHLCYCHTPVRFAWDMQAQYLQESGLTYGLKSLFARAVLHYIRNWDVRSSNGVDQFVANSSFVARRINKIYRRDSLVMYPPVDVDNFTLETKKEDYYITTSRLVPYKRIDLIVEAFNRMPDKKLLVIGEGPDFYKIKGKAGPNVQMLGHQPFAQLKQYMQKARAFVFAAEEDFGIVPVEAQACGTPVIAFGRGGVTESVIPGVTGQFFETQTIDALIAAVQRFEQSPPLDPVVIRQNAERFSGARFKQELKDLVEEHWQKFLGRLETPARPSMAPCPNVVEHESKPAMEAPPPVAEEVKEVSA